jgi:hypothetical protein
VKLKLKKWLVRGIVVFGVLILVGFGFRDFWLRQVRAYVLGLAEIRAEELGYRLPDVDEIEVFRWMDLLPTPHRQPTGFSAIASMHVLRCAPRVRKGCRVMALSATRQSLLCHVP